jgi:predicted RNA-binding protein
MRRAGMCQSNAYLEDNGQEELILEDVGLIKPEDGKILLISIFGEEELVDADIKMIDLLHHKIVLQKA